MLPAKSDFMFRVILKMMTQLSIENFFEEKSGY